MWGSNLRVAAGPFQAARGARAAEIRPKFNHSSRQARAFPAGLQMQGDALGLRERRQLHLQYDEKSVRELWVLQPAISHISVTAKLNKDSGSSV